MTKNSITKKNQIKAITKCRVCESNKLTKILSLGKQKLSDFIELSDDTDIPAYPLDLILCENCFLLQLLHTTPPHELYTDRYGYRSGINQTMRSELKEIITLAEQVFKLKDDDIVVDIGCNDGTTLSSYTNPKLHRVGFDPVKPFRTYFEQNLHQAGIKNYTLFSDFFTSAPFLDKFPKSKAKIVSAISMFYDLDDPNKFVSDICQILDKNGLLIIQQNYLAGMLNLCAFDNIVHEHLEFYSLKSLEHLLSRHNLEVFDVQETLLNGGSFRTFIRFKGSKIDLNGGRERVRRMRKQEKKLGLDQKSTYINFANRVKNLKSSLKRFINKEVKAGKRVYIYGASTRGNTLIQTCRLDNRLIAAAVERNTDKWGKKIASVHIPIISEDQARLDHPDYFLILPWFFRDEFLEREREYLNKGGKMIFPLPQLELVSIEENKLTVVPLSK